MAFEIDWNEGSLDTLIDMQPATAFGISHYKVMQSQSTSLGALLCLVLLRFGLFWKQSLIQELAYR